MARHATMAVDNQDHSGHLLPGYIAGHRVRRPCPTGFGGVSGADTLGSDSITCLERPPEHCSHQFLFCNCSDDTFYPDTNRVPVVSMVAPWSQESPEKECTR